MRLLYSILVFITANSAMASDLTFDFKSPAFSGIGYSSHVLTIEQLEANRKQKIKEDRQAEIDKAERELKSTNAYKFKNNLESRIYATLSKQMVDAMFADCSDSCATSGSADIEGNSINWVKDEVTGTITLVVDGDDGYTEIVIPGAGEFNF